MKRHTKMLASALAALMLITSFGCFAAYAESMPVEPIIQEPVEENPDVVNAPDMPVDGDNGDGDGGDNGYQPYNPDDAPVETGYYNGDDEPNNGYSDNNNNNYNNNGGTDSGNYSGNNGNGWVDGDGNVYSSPNEVYVGGGQSYNPPQSTAPSAALYDVQKKKADEKTLSGNDWNDIASKLRNASNDPAEDDGSGDFAFIQQNTAKEDNGYWIIIAGVGCLLLSLTGFIYLIASAVSRRKRMKAITASGSSSGGYYRANDDYDDGYKPAKKEKTPRNGKRYK